MNVNFYNSNHLLVLSKNKDYLQVFGDDETSKIQIGSKFFAVLGGGKKYIKAKLIDKNNKEYEVYLHIESACQQLHCSKEELLSAEGNEKELDALISKREKEIQQQFLRENASKVAVQKPTGLTVAQENQINEYINVHFQQWSEISYQDWLKEHADCLRLPKEETGLPRTLEIFKSENGTIQVFILLKTKRVIDPIGSGSTKTAKLAMNWKTHEQFANVVASGDDIADVIQEEAIMRQVANQPGIAQPMQFLHQYTSKDGKKKIAFYMHLYEGNLKDLLKQKGLLTLEDKLQMAKDILTATSTLVKAQIEYRDTKEENIFFEKDVTGAYHLFKGDFGTAIKIQNPKSPKEVKKKYSDFYQGSPLYISPEKVYLEEKLFNLKLHFLSKQKDKDGFKAALIIDIKPILDSSQTKTDVWSDGIVLLRMFTDDALREPSQSYAYRIQQIIKESCEKSKGNYAKFNSIELQNQIDALLDEVEKACPQNFPNGIMPLIRKMLIVDPMKRITAEDAVHLI